MADVQDGFFPVRIMSTVVLTSHQRKCFARQRETHIHTRVNGMYSKYEKRKEEDLFSHVATWSINLLYVFGSHVYNVDGNQYAGR